MIEGSLPLVRAGVDGLRAYASASVVIAILISIFGVQRIDFSAKGWRNIGFRLLIIPGLALLWPWLIKRLWLGAPAAVERNALMPAGVALLDVTTQRCRAAALDVGHDATLPAAERVSVLLTIGRADLAEDVRHLEPRGAQRSPQKCEGSAALVCGGAMSGSRSNGLVVAQMVLVATFR